MVEVVKVCYGSIRGGSIIFESKDLKENSGHETPDRSFLVPNRMEAKDCFY